MQRPGTAKGHQRKIARIIALADRDQPQRTVHGFVDDRDDSGCGFHQRQAERIRNGLHAALRRFAIELEGPTEQVFGQVAQHDIGIGYRRQFAAAPIGRRPRHGTGGLRADPQGPGQFRHTGDRTTARADRLHI